MATPDLEDLHEWVSFEDPDEDRTWVIDVTFLTSAWTCIFGRGCQGVLTGPAADLQQGCCSYGAHFIDKEDLATVEKAVERLTKENWQMRKRSKAKGWYRQERDGTYITRVVDGACIFLNREGFATGPGCALHVGALEARERPLDWKPDVCWQLPLRQIDHTDDHGHITSTLREWKRRDWGEGGHEFHWWCTESPDAFIDAKMVWQTLTDEIVEMVGSKVFVMLAGYLKSRPSKTYLPHPAVRR
ncbi:MAG: hypothetical protein AB7V43_16195 [Acidimicrobiia bacterium]